MTKTLVKSKTSPKSAVDPLEIPASLRRTKTVAEIKTKANEKANAVAEKQVDAAMAKVAESRGVTSPAPKETVAVHVAPEKIKVVGKRGKDLLAPRQEAAAKKIEDLKKKAKAEKVEPMSAEKRESVLSLLRADLLALERHEVRLCLDMEVPLRPNVSPQAVLGVEVSTATYIEEPVDAALEVAA